MKHIVAYTLIAILGIQALQRKMVAEILPSFRLDMATWNATDIAIVTEGAIIDGRVTVVQPLKGDIRTGEVILISEMGKFADTSWRRLGSTLYDPTRPNLDLNQPVISAERMIVFLKICAAKGKTAPNHRSEVGNIRIEGRPNQRWAPSGFGREIETSTVWLNGGNTYSFVQQDNPGPTTLINLARTEDALLARLREIVAAQADLNRIETMTDKAVGAKQAVKYIDDQCRDVRKYAFTVLGRCGHSSISLLQEILQDPKRSGLHEEAVRAIALVDGRDVDDILVQGFKQEILLWEKLGPSLQCGWWNGTGLDWNDVLRHRDNYGRTLAYITAFQSRPLESAREALDQFRRFWRSLPQLEDPSGLTHMSEACDAAIRRIEKGAGC